MCHPFCGSAWHSICLACSHTSPLHPCCCCCILWWLLVFSPGHVLSLVDHLVQISSGSIPSAAEVISIGLLWCHFVRTSSGIILITIIDAPVPSFCLPAVNLHGFGMLFFIMVPVAGQPLFSNVFLRFTDVKYQSKKTCVPLGTNSTKCWIAAAPMPNAMSVKVFFPWNISKFNIRPSGEARTNIFSPVGYGFLVKGIICSYCQCRHFLVLVG